MRQNLSSNTTSLYQPLDQPNNKNTGQPRCGLCRATFAVALAVSLFSLIACVVLWVTRDDLVRVYVFDTKLALFVDRAGDATCRNTTLFNTSQCPADIVATFESTFHTSPCTAIQPLASAGDDVQVKWGNMSYARYPVVTDARQSWVFWGSWFAHMKPIAALFSVYLVSLFFQIWRAGFFVDLDRDYSGAAECPYGSQCQFDKSVYDNSDWSWTRLFLFRPAHGAHFAMWLEYTLTASLQIVVVCLNFQGFSVNELWLILALHASMTMIGYIVECNLDFLFMPCKHQHGKDPVLLRQPRGAAALARVFVAEVFAWIIHGTLWALIFGKYNQVKAEVDLLRAQASDATCGHAHDIQTIPGWVEAILYSQVVFFSLFGAVQFFQIGAFLYHALVVPMGSNEKSKQKYREGNLRVWQGTALAYAALNVGSKAALAVILIFGAAM